MESAEFPNVKLNKIISHLHNIYDNYYSYKLNLLIVDESETGEVINEAVVSHDELELCSPSPDLCTRELEDLSVESTK